MPIDENEPGSDLGAIAGDLPDEIRFNNKNTSPDPENFVADDDNEPDIADDDDDGDDGNGCNLPPDGEDPDCQDDDDDDNDDDFQGCDDCNEIDDEDVGAEIGEDA